MTVSSVNLVIIPTQNHFLLIMYLWSNSYGITIRWISI